MSWTFNGIRIYTQGFSNSVASIIAKLQPVNAATVYQYFGYESPKLSLRGLVATSASIASLEGYVQSGASYTLSGPEGAVGDYIVKSVSSDLEQAVYLSLFDQPSLDPETPLYMVSLELYEDV